MATQDPYVLEPGSDRFLSLCARLNTTIRADDAEWSVDIMSGGFKFNDEIPDGLRESPDVFLPLITLLRCLWAYRVSLVEGQPRADLALWWDSALHLAPHWAGFTPHRCSAAMQPVVADVKSKGLEFARDVERLEARLRRNRDIPNIETLNEDNVRVKSY
jgi:hypothetical protein